MGYQIEDMMDGTVMVVFTPRFFQVDEGSGNMGLTLTTLEARNLAENLTEFCNRLEDEE